VEENPPRPVGRPGTKPGAAPDLRTRERDQGLCAAGILVGASGQPQGPHQFSAKLTQLAGKKLDQFDIPGDAEHADILARLQDQPATVTSIEKKKKSRSPAAPFTTSTLQQEAVRKLGMTTDRTMRTAQQLYEGIDIGQGTVGLITYMRTDSVALANEAVEEIRTYIGDTFNNDFLPKNPVAYKNKSKNAQEAHEAIRPTSILRTPESVKPFLTTDQFKLYDMVWKRTLACQMAPAKFDTTSVDITMGEGIFRASGQVQTFAGFLAVYEEDVDDAEDEDNAKLPLLEEGDSLPVDKLYGEQHFTQPPPLLRSQPGEGAGRIRHWPSVHLRQHHLHAERP
jgi:DNA topoisomerase-1